MGYVYKITNTVNNKSYIGISIHEPEKRRIRDHLSGYGNRIIANAVKKYGKDAFTYEILEANVFPELLPDLEVAYIEKFNTVAPHGYNLNSGGDHKIPSEETRRKLSDANRGKTLSVEHRRKLSEAQKGKTHSEATLRKMSEAQKGKTHSAETRRKMSEARKGEKNPNFGKTLSVEHRRKLSEVRKGKKRKPHSTETRRKISKANKGKPRSAETRRKISEANKGEKNPNFGKTPSTETRRKLSEAGLHPDHIPAREYFLSLPPDMPLKEKRRLLYTTFRNVSKRTIRRWTYKWLAS